MEDDFRKKSVDHESFSYFSPRFLSWIVGSQVSEYKRPNAGYLTAMVILICRFIVMSISSGLNGPSIFAVFLK